MASSSISRLISSSIRASHSSIRYVVGAINGKTKCTGLAWSSSPEEMTLSASQARVASNVVSTHLQLGKAEVSSDQNGSSEKCLGELNLPGLVAGSTLLCSPLPDITAALQLLSLEDRAIRLPSFEKKSPLTTPPSAPVNPHQLPHTPGSTSTIVEPYQDLLPRLLPAMHEGMVIECVNLVRLRRKKMKKHKRKKQYKKNRVSHEHRILMDIVRREKVFMLEQTTLLNEAEQFSAEQYVADKIKSYKRPVPKFWRGKRLPESVVIGLMRKKGLSVPGLDD